MKIFDNQFIINLFESFSGSMAWKHFINSIDIAMQTVQKFTFNICIMFTVNFIFDNNLCSDKSYTHFNRQSLGFICQSIR